VAGPTLATARAIAGDQRQAISGSPDAAGLALEVEFALPPSPDATTLHRRIGREHRFERNIDLEIASITASLAPLAVLACPVGMGAMIWMMMRANKSQEPSKRESPPQNPPEPASLELLREEHNRLSEEIDRLERRHTESFETPERR
jgi:hypothetical protein